MTTIITCTTTTTNNNIKDYTFLPSRKLHRHMWLKLKSFLTTMQILYWC